jgi:DNA-3-methyladenine glycosylase II
MTSGPRAVPSMVSKKLILAVVPPFRLDFTVWALRRRKTNVVDRWDGDRYLRVIVFNNIPVKITAASTGVMSEPSLVVTLQAESEITDRLRNEVELLIQKMLGLTMDLKPFYMLVKKNDFLEDLVQQYLGVKPPCFPSIFEALMNSIACQQVSLDVGILIINRLAENIGMEFAEDGTIFHAFPRPKDLANISERDLAKLGFSSQKVRAIKELATGVVDGKLNLTLLEEMTNKEIVEFVSSLRGFGRWSAEYVLLRGFGRITVFPGDDIGAKNNLQRLFQLDEQPSYEKIRELTSQWHPYQGLVYFHLLLDKLHAKGFV